MKAKLVPGWRNFEPLRADVKITISDVLFPQLPDPAYSEQECEVKGFEVYQFVYDNYRDARALVEI